MGFAERRSEVQKEYMPTAVLPLAADSAPRRKRFTRGETERMLVSGFFDGRRFELIDGDLIDKTGQRPSHAASIQLILEWLCRIFGVRNVRSQLPMDVAAADRALNEPEPDFIVLAEVKPEYRNRHPRGDETLLVVEVADTSIRQDTVCKRDLYARAGVPEYWVVNIADRELIVHRGLKDCRYGEVITLAEDTAVSLSSRPGESIQVAMLLP